MTKSWVIATLLILVSIPSYPQVAPKNTQLGRSVPGWGVSLNPLVALNHKNHGNIAVIGSPHLKYWSNDAGGSWMECAPDTTRGIEVELVSDARGNFYSFFLSANGPSGIVDKESVDEGKSWTAGTLPIDTKGGKAFWPHGSAHFLKGQLYLTWTQFDTGQSGSTCQSNLYFSTSNEHKWSDPVLINQGHGTCTEDDSTILATAPVISMEGRLFVCWFRNGNAYFDRSYDAGKTWLGSDLIIAANRKGLGMKIPGICMSACLPSLAVDNSLSFFRSSLYLVWSDQTVGDDDSDIWFLRSTNRGDLWSIPIRVNQDNPGKHQFSPWITVDHATGIIYIVYYDRRAYNDTSTDVYLAYSVDGGRQFKELKVSETPFATSDQRTLCDHPEICAANGVIAITWTRLDEEGSSLWTAVLKQEDLIKHEDVPKLQTIRKQ